MKAWEREVMREGQALFARILMKYDYAERKPIVVDGVKMHAAHFHMIEAIGKGYGDTVTALADYFIITKGAVSQIVTRLYGEGYVSKTKREGNDKEIILGLTAKGLKAFKIHEGYGQPMEARIKFAGRYTEKEMRSFLCILEDVDRVFGEMIENDIKE